MNAVEFTNIYTILQEELDFKNFNFLSDNDAISSISNLISEEKDPIRKKILSFFFDLYCVDSSSEYFKEFVKNNHALLKRDMYLFYIIIEKIEINIIKTKMYDFFWERSVFYKKKDISLAVKACTGYLSEDINYDNFFNQKIRISRGLNLGGMLKSNSVILETIVKKINFLEEVYFSGCSKCWSFNLDVAEILYNFYNKLKDPKEIVRVLLEKSKTLMDNNSFYNAHLYYEEVYKWVKKNNVEQDCYAIKVDIANAHYKEALFYMENDVNQSYMLASKHFNDALLIYRDVPKKYRCIWDVENKIRECNSSKEKSDTLRLNEMSVFRSRSIDVSSIKKDVEDYMSSNSLIESLVRFSRISHEFSVTSSEKEAKQKIANNPLTFLFSSQNIRLNGRNAASRPSYNFHDNDDPLNKEVIHSVMVEDYILRINLFTRAYLIPALDYINFFMPSLESFIEIVVGSRLVEANRVVTVATGFYNGFNKDIISAIHILAPQIENFVRCKLKEIGVVTTNAQNNNEVGLSNLMEKSEVETVFSPETIFEINSLFCGKYGPNLRNEIAHGLIVDSAIDASSIYAWWWFLKMFINAFVENMDKENAEIAQLEERHPRNV